MDNDQVASWMRRVLHKLAERTGAAVACVDHVIKNGNGGGRFAVGAQAKLAGVDGAVYLVESITPLGAACPASWVLRIGKDRRRTGPARDGHTAALTGPVTAPRRPPG